MKVELTEFDTVFLELSYDWLRDPEIKELTMTPDITKESQSRWYDSLKENYTYMVKGVLVDGKPVGAVGLKHIDFDNQKAEYFGYIGRKEWWGMSIGNDMMELIEKEAVSKGMHHIYLHVRKDNERAIRLYVKKGYSIVSMDGALYRMEKII